MPLDDTPPDSAYSDIQRTHGSIWDAAADRADKAAQRKCPQDQEAEQALLGCLLVDNRVMDKIGDLVQAADFYAPAHGRIFEAIATLIGNGRTAAPTTLKLQFADDPDLAAIGGGGYLADLVAAVVSVGSAPEIARHISELAGRRKIIELADEMIADAGSVSADLPISDIIERAESELFELGGGNKASTTEPMPFGSVALEVIQAAEEAYRADGRPLGRTTGLIDLNKKLGGLMPGNLIVIAGRPAMGKTALATNIAFELAKTYRDGDRDRGAKVAFFSLEMTRKELGGRIAGQQAGLSSKKLRDGTLDKTEFHQFMNACQHLATLPLWIDDTPALSVAQIRARSRRLARQGGLGAIVIDYLQLLRGSGSRQARDNRANEIGENTRALKALAKELGVPVIGLSQLSRGVDQRDDNRPTMSDLKESGSIEQDADVVVFVYREEYYLEGREPKRGGREKPETFEDRRKEWELHRLKVQNRAELIVGKHRGGPVGTVRVHWNGEITRFSDLTADYSLGGV